MQGLAEEQISDLNLKDEWQSKCTPSGGHQECKDPVGRRSGLAPNEQMADILNRTRNEAKAEVSKVSFLCQLSLYLKVLDHN